MSEDMTQKARIQTTNIVGSVVTVTHETISIIDPPPWSKLTEVFQAYLAEHAPGHEFMGSNIARDVYFEWRPRRPKAKVNSPKEGTIYERLGKIQTELAQMSPGPITARQARKQAEELREALFAALAAMTMLNSRTLDALRPLLLDETQWSNLWQQLLIMSGQAEQAEANLRDAPAERTRPTEPAFRVAARVAEHVTFITGEIPGRSVHGTTGMPVGPFIKLIGNVFNALGIERFEKKSGKKKSVEHYARQAIEEARLRLNVSKPNETADMAHGV